MNDRIGLEIREGPVLDTPAIVIKQENILSSFSFFLSGKVQEEEKHSVTQINMEGKKRHKLIFLQNPFARFIEILNASLKSEESYNF